jgi:hypothetical protein
MECAIYGINLRPTRKIMPLVLIGSTYLVCSMLLIEFVLRGFAHESEYVMSFQYEETF